MKLIIPELCKKLGISLVELAKKTGIARMSLWRYSQGLQDPSLSHALNIAQALGISIEQLISLPQKKFNRTFTKAVRKQLRRQVIQQDKSWVPILMMSFLKERESVQIKKA